MALIDYSRTFFYVLRKGCALTIAAHGNMRGECIFRGVGNIEIFLMFGNISFKFASGLDA